MCNVINNRCLVDSIDHIAEEVLPSVQQVLPAHHVQLRLVHQRLIVLILVQNTHCDWLDTCEYDRVGHSPERIYDVGSRSAVEELEVEDNEDGILNKRICDQTPFSRWLTAFL